jgi:hypothetical protein
MCPPIYIWAAGPIGAVQSPITLLHFYHRLRSCRPIVEGICNKDVTMVPWFNSYPQGQHKKRLHHQPNSHVQEQLSLPPSSRFGFNLRRNNLIADAQLRKHWCFHCFHVWGSECSETWLRHAQFGVLKNSLLFYSSIFVNLSYIWAKRRCISSLQAWVVPEVKTLGYLLEELLFDLNDHREAILRRPKLVPCRHVQRGAIEIWKAIDVAMRGFFSSRQYTDVILPKRAYMMIRRSFFERLYPSPTHIIKQL